MINDINIFTIYESLPLNVIKVLPKIDQIKVKFREKVSSSGFNYKERT